MSSAQLNQRVRDLAPRAQLSFTLLLCERMVPNLELYADLTGLDAGTARSALEALWAVALGDKKQIGEHWCDKVDELLDQLDDGDSCGALAALHGAMAVRCALDLVTQNDHESAIDVSRLSRDDVRQFLIAQFGEDVVLRDQPLMQDEFAIQDTLLEALSAPLDRDDLLALRAELREVGVTNLGIATR